MIIKATRLLGPRGRSSYQEWLAIGNQGSEEDFVESLKSEVPGPPGDTSEAEAFAQQAASSAEEAIGAVSEEAETRAAADLNLATNLSAESSARQSADSSLATNLSAEATDRANADASLASEILSEKSARESGDSTLASGLVAEAAARATADATLSSNIAAEKAAREVADAALGENLSGEVAARVEAVAAVDGKVESALELLSPDVCAALAARPVDRTVTGAIISCSGYHEAGDGGGGAFRVRAAQPGEVPDQGMTFVLSDGRVAERLDEPSARRFGARGDGISNDSVRLSALFNFCCLSGRSAIIDEGDFLVGSIIDVEIAKGQRLEIIGRGKARFRIRNAAVGRIRFNAAQVGETRLASILNVGDEIMTVEDVALIREGDVCQLVSGVAYSLDSQNVAGETFEVVSITGNDLQMDSHAWYRVKPSGEIEYVSTGATQIRYRGYYAAASAIQITKNDIPLATGWTASAAAANGNLITFSPAPASGDVIKISRSNGARVLVFRGGRLRVANVGWVLDYNDTGDGSGACIGGQGLKGAILEDLSFEWENFPKHRFTSHEFIGLHGQGTIIRRIDLRGGGYTLRPRGSGILVEDVTGRWCYRVLDTQGGTKNVTGRRIRGFDVSLTLGNHAGNGSDFEDITQFAGNETWRNRGYGFSLKRARIEALRSETTSLQDQGGAQVYSYNDTVCIPEDNPQQIYRSASQFIRISFEDVRVSAPNGPVSVSCGPCDSFEAINVDLGVNSTISADGMGPPRTRSMRLDGVKVGLLSVRGVTDDLRVSNFWARLIRLPEFDLQCVFRNGVLDGDGATQLVRDTRRGNGIRSMTFDHVSFKNALRIVNYESIRYAGNAYTSYLWTGCDFENIGEGVVGDNKFPRANMFYWEAFRWGQISNCRVIGGSTPRMSWPFCDLLNVSWTAPPVEGVWKIGARIPNSNPTPGNFAWICTTHGIALTGSAQWQAETSYDVDDLVWKIDGGIERVYRCMTGGVSGSIGPVGTSTNNQTDGSVVWQYLVTRAQFMASA